MKKILVHLANGFEEIEAITPVDVWRRAGFHVVVVSMNGTYQVSGSHQITVTADELFEDIDYDQYDVLFLPGGMPGAANLDKHEGLSRQLVNFNKSGRIVAAICAAPLVLGHNNLLKGKKATCFPGYEKELWGAEYTGKSIQLDGNIITGKGAGVAMQFALYVVKTLNGEQAARDLAAKMQLPDDVHF